MQRTEFSFGKNKGLWRCYCSIIDIKKNGKSLRVSKTGKTKTEARERLEAEIAKLEMERITGVKPKKSDETVGQAIDRYIAEAKLKRAKLASSTVEYWLRIKKNQIDIYDIAETKIEKVTHQDILDWIQELASDGTSKAMQKKAYNVITMVFSDYFEMMPAKNPAYGLKFESAVKKVESTQVLSDEEMRRYFKACEDVLVRTDEEGAVYIKDADLLEFLLMTYMRKSEALALSFEDFLESEQKVIIRKTVTREEDGTRVIKVQNKTKTSAREIHLNDLACSILNVRLANAEYEQGFDPSDLIFPGAKGKKSIMSDNSLKRMNERILEKAGIRKHIRVHDLRHSGISYFLRHDGSLADISKRAGHSKQSITADIYSHAIEESLKRQSQKESKISEDLVNYLL